jgi:hypothetical protein
MARLKGKGGAGGLTDEQEMFLLHAFTLSGEQAFENDAAAAAAWREHRSELVAKWTRPGSRPMALYLYDLDCKRLPLRWSGEGAILVEHGLLTTDEMVRMERDHRELDPGQPADYADPKYIGKGEGHGTPTPIETRIFSREQELAEARFVESWHRTRGREALAEKYRQRAEVFERMVDELKEKTSSHDSDLGVECL